MRTRVRAILCLWCPLFAAGPAEVLAQTPVSFRDALEMTRTNNERWRGADAGVARAQEQRAEQRGLYWPSLSVSGRYAHLEDRLFVDLNSLRGLLQSLNPAVPVPPLSATVLRNDPAKVSLNASWTVFAGGRILAANRAAQAALVAAGHDRRATQQQVTTELVDRYFKRRLAGEVLKVRKQALETLKRHVEDAHKLKAAGQIARTEELRAEVARAEAERDFRDATRDVTLATTALQATLATAADVVPATPLPRMGSLEPRDRFASAADSANPGLGRLTALREQARQQTVAARADYFPAVRVFGQQEILQHRLNSTTDPKWLVAVGLQWELFDGFGREHRVGASRRAEEVVALQRDQARRDVRTLVQDRYDEYASALEQYNSLQTSVALAKESLRSEQQAFTAGVGTSLSVVDAELALSRIQVGRLTALYDMTLSLALLLEASGQSGRFLEYLDRAGSGEESDEPSR